MQRIPPLVLSLQIRPQYEKQANDEAVAAHVHREAAEVARRVGGLEHLRANHVADGPGTEQ